MAEPWRCPFCGHHSTVGSNDVSSGTGTFDDGTKYGAQYIRWTSVTCPNKDCREYTFSLTIHDATPAPSGGYVRHKRRHSWQLVPAAEMQILPDYVPDAIVADYKEACLIANLSPKASATLSRRCMQGMIRDYWRVTPGRLVDEIKAISDKVHPETWDAIEAVRNIGNIGAHMESDINIIVDVEPQEAKLMISLVETLVDDWYVTSFERKSRLAKLASAAAEKLALKKKPPNDSAE